MSYIYMKALEHKAEKYDKSIKLITFGKLPKIEEYIVDNFIKENDTVYSKIF